MARHTVSKAAKLAVYPPRYFTGFVELQPYGAREPVRVRFANAPFIPLCEHCCAIFPGTRHDAFYSAVTHGRNFPAGYMLAIQYAISVYDARSDSYAVEKFNHPFDHPKAVTIRREGVALMMKAHAGQKLFRVYRADEVMHDLRPAAVPVVQFIA